MIRTCGFIVACLAIFSQAAAESEETPATPIIRQAPLYPAECFTKLPEELPAHFVTLAFDIDKRGNVENVRVRDASDPCFEPVAVEATRDWKYEPRRVEG